MSYEAQAAHAPLPGPAIATITVPSGSSSTASDLSAYVGKWVVMVSSVKTHLVAGASGVSAATTNDVWLPADTLVQFKVTAKRAYVRAYGNGGAGTLAIAVVDED